MLSNQAEEAKSNLIAFQAEIEKLKAEKEKMLAKRENALVQKKIQEQLSSLSVDADLKALTSVREDIQKLEAEVQVNKEIASQNLDVKLKNIKQKATNLAAKKRVRRIKKTNGIKKRRNKYRKKTLVTTVSINK
ncbi:MAG: hypothetical protein KatS3mg068_1297 [Candidatus Sericytochromatia bacterium]|nr:MAG: hypothetical protein KatS3mg068_1297 [Candidatus Sericytochromatia bacterium]